MTPTLQADLATEARTSQANQPNTVTAPAPLAAVPAPATVKTVAKRVTRTPVKKLAAPAKQATRVVVKPVASKTPPRVTAKPVVRPAPTIAPKVEVKAAVKVQPKTAATATAKLTEIKLLKPKKPKLVRDSFTIPKLEYLKLEELKHRSVKLGTSIKKSELIRAGILALTAMSDANFLKVTKAVPAIKTGRPAKD